MALCFSKPHLENNLRVWTGTIKLHQMQVLKPVLSASYILRLLTCRLINKWIINQSHMSHSVLVPEKEKAQQVKYHYQVYIAMLLLCSLSRAANSSVGHNNNVLVLQMFTLSSTFFPPTFSFLWYSYLKPFSSYSHFNSFLTLHLST